ncbi:serine protease grass-like [Teleopsis dalmanni]|uniref:serine protease grass-like n=1 Tax=Teleopsis dalmanni TaxID=139649 RepID=UPI0018CD9B05|nr:serine protease grass-like [Teleopsis dalmanni]
MESRDLPYFLIAISVLIGLSAVANAQTCLTPTGSYGTCVPIQSCLEIANEIRRYNGYLPQSLKDQLIQLRCPGPSPNDINICCDSLPNNGGDDYESSLNQYGLQILNDLKCGVPNGDRVAFGEKAKLGEFPWMALIKYNSVDKPYKCGGTLITHRHVLTAGHCLSATYNIVGVRLGEHDMNTDPDCEKRGRKFVCMPPVVEYGVEKIISHPDYKRRTLVNDVAIIKLNRDVEFNKHIKPICLPITKRSIELQSEQLYLVAGWGTTENSTSSSVLMKGLVKHQELGVCQNVFRRMRLTNEHLCAGGEGRIDACKGDSGGPLFFMAPYKTSNRYVQFGIVSFGVAACGLEEALPGVYANIIPLMPWITSNLT